MIRLTEEQERYAKVHQEELVDLILTLCRIPAPSHREDARAAFVRDWLENAGAKGVYLDEAKNVVFPMNCEGKDRIAVFMAHTDTVFPDLTPMEPVMAEGKIHCPGVGDDTANLALMLLIVRYLLENDHMPSQGALFVANSCEEGLGNLKGCRWIMEAYRGRIGCLTSFDGGLEDYVDYAVGSKRYQVTVTTEGGHSYGSFGNRNAIQYMASLIDTLYTLKVPKGGKSTYNVGVIQGGTSVNTIAQRCEMLFEYRSDVGASLNAMDAFFHRTLQAYEAMGIGVTAELVGDRPCMGNVPEKAEEQLRQRVRDAVSQYTGVVPMGHSGSTDCNIPLSMGVPSICFGGYRGHGAHTREEYIEVESLLPGMKAMLSYILEWF